MELIKEWLVIFICHPMVSQGFCDGKPVKTNVLSDFLFPDTRGHYLPRCMYGSEGSQYSSANIKWIGLLMPLFLHSQRTAEWLLAVLNVHFISNKWKQSF